MSKKKARCAITGQYVTQKYAKSHPKTTIFETPKKRRGK